MNKSVLKKVGMGIALGITLLPFLALAAPAYPAAPIVTTEEGLTTLIEKVAKWFGGLILVLSIIMILYAAFLYLVSGANSEAQGKAKTALTYAIVGIVVALLAFSVPTVVINILQ